MHRFLRIGSFVLPLLLTPALHADPLIGAVDPDIVGNAAEGEKISSRCTPCHGKNGISTYDTWPNLAGQKYSYLVIQIKNFRSGFRKNSMMEPLAKALNDQQIADLATFFNTMGVKK